MLVCSLVKRVSSVKHLIEVVHLLEIEEKDHTSNEIKTEIVTYVVSHAYVHCSLRTFVAHILSPTLNYTNKMHGAPMYSTVQTSII